MAQGSASAASIIPDFNNVLAQHGLLRPGQNRQERMDATLQVLKAEAAAAAGAAGVAVPAAAAVVPAAPESAAGNGVAAVTGAGADNAMPAAMPLIAAPGLLRGIGPDDTQRLLSAVAAGKDAVNSCVADICQELGLSSEQCQDITRLAVLLTEADEVVASSRSALKQVEKQRLDSLNQLNNLRQARGLEPVSDENAKRSLAADETWAKVPQSGPIPLGEGPSGGIGVGFTLPSLANRAAAAAEEARVQATAAVAPNTDPVTTAGTEAAFMKKIDAASRSDFAQQQQDLEKLRTGDVGLNSVLLEQGVQQVDPVKLQQQEAESAFYMSLLPEINLYFDQLAKAVKKEAELHSSHLKENPAKINTRLDDVVSGFITQKSAMSAVETTKQGAKTAAAGDSETGDNFTLSHQGAYGYDVNDQRHRGSQLAASVSLSRNEASVVPGGSMNLPPAPAAAPVAAAPAAAGAAAAAPAVVAASGDAVSVVAELTPPISDKPAPDLAAYEKTDTAARSTAEAVDPAVSSNGTAAGSFTPVSLAAAATAVNSKPGLTVVSGAGSLPKSDNVKRSLNAMMSSLQESEGLTGDSVSLDDILGTSSDDDAPINIASVVQSQDTASGLRSGQDVADLTPASLLTPAAGGHSTTGMSPVQHQADLPPWEMPDDSKKLQPLNAQDQLQPAVVLNTDTTSAALMVRSAAAAAGAEAVSGASGDTSAQTPVIIGAAQVSADRCAVDLVPNLGAQGGTVVSTVTGGADNVVSLPAQAQDVAVTGPAIEEQKLVLATARLEQVTAQGRYALNESERQEQSKALGRAALDMLSSFEEKLSRDTVLATVQEQSPWALMSNIKVLTIDDHKFGVQQSPQPKLSQVSQFNMLAQNENARAADRELRHQIFTADLSFTSGVLLPVEGYNAVLAYLASEQRKEQERQRQESEREAVLQQQLIELKNQGYDCSVPSPEQLDAILLHSARAAAQAAAPAAAPASTSVAVSVAPVPAVPITAAPGGAMQPGGLGAASTDGATAGVAVVVGGTGKAAYEMGENIPAPPEDWEVPDYDDDYVPPAVNMVDFSGDEDEINDEVFSGGNDMGHTEYGTDYAAAALAMQEEKNSSGSGTSHDLPVVVGERKVTILGKRRMQTEDFLTQIPDSDGWYQLLLQVFPDNGLLMAALVGSKREIDPTAPNHWRIYIDSSSDLGLVAHNFWHDAEQRFSSALGQKITLEVVGVDGVPQESPLRQAAFKEQEKVAQARLKLGRIRGLAQLLNVLNEHIDHVGIELYCPDVPVLEAK